jgi:hypothetical protein
MLFRHTARPFVLISLLLLMLFVSGTALAQTQLTAGDAIALEDPESKIAVRELVSQLNDEAVRALLIERLDAVAEAKELEVAKQGNFSTVLQQGFSAYWNNSITSTSRSAEIPSIVSRVMSSI